MGEVQRPSPHTEGIAISGKNAGEQPFAGGVRRKAFGEFQPLIPVIVLVLVEVLVEENRDLSLDAPRQQHDHQPQPRQEGDDQQHRPLEAFAEILHPFAEQAECDQVNANEKDYH